MQLRTVLIGLLALVFGSSAAAGVYLVSQQPNVTPKGDVVGVVCVKEDVARGVKITPRHVEVREWPKAMVPEGALTKIEDAENLWAIMPLMKNEPVVRSKLGNNALSHKIRPGMRAVTIQTPTVSTGMAGFIQPGDKVDVLVTINSARGDELTGGAGTLTLLQHVEVMAVDQRLDAPTEGPVSLRELRSVTLLVTPEEATRVNLGQSKGTLSLTLRNPEDVEVTPGGVATMTDLRAFPDLRGDDGASSANVDLLQFDEGQAEQAVSEEEQLVSRRLQPKGSQVLPPIRTIRGSINGSVQMYPVVTYY